ncbi:MAG: ATP-dependent DNA helicase RecG [Planctomycetaceae bacterium]|nr:ATP-dependent DNA helicase RecG [Planctomycetaceae bacterium]
MSDTDFQADDLPEEVPLLERLLRYVPGIGPARAALLANLGLQSVGDLLWYMPRDVLDLSQLSGVQELTEDRMHTLRGKVVDVDSRALSRGRTLVGAILRTEGGLVRGLWFNQPWMQKRLMSDQWVLWSGKPKFRENRWEISSPRIQWLDADEEDAQGEVLTKYGLTEGLSLDALRRMIASVLELVEGQLADVLPEKFRLHYKLPKLPDALRNLHRPASLQDYQAARRRVVFDEQLVFQLGLALRRRVRETTELAPPIQVPPKVDARIRRLFPFDFTPGQEQAITELTGDLGQDKPMHRLLQADVGAGKTVVAIYAMLAAIASGYQAVLMAPTELLARQHWLTINQALQHSRVKRTLLTSGLTATQRRDTLANIASGALQLIIGTQAVIQQDVQYRNLGLVVIDEQHKFGVVQRARFRGLALSPHVLVMTATPIPRSLCLTLYGDLDLSVMQDLPPGRQVVITSRVETPVVEQKAWNFVREKLRAGRQAYVVCPYVDSPDPEAPAGALQVFEHLSREFAEFRVGLVHGRMDRNDQQQVMTAFRDREIQLLVATTVVEVGVDVPNATLMVILDAHQFGLSQLHQMRGRIGRGTFQGYCFLFSNTDNEDSRERLAALERSTSGFEIAEVDFSLRGPGNVLGTEQHGAVPFRVTSLPRDDQIVEETRRAASRMVSHATIDQPEFAALKRAVIDRYGEQLDLPRTG